MSPHASPSPEEHRELGRLLERLGSRAAPDSREWESIFELVYAELHRLADLLLHDSDRDRTVSPTVLVHEAFLRLGGDQNLRWENRAHFFGIAARAMRQVLSRYSERARAEKRGGGWQRVTLNTSLSSRDEQFDFVELDEVLDRLAAEHARMAKVSELKIFAGMSSREIAEALGVSKRTVDGDWALARKWLSRELS